MSVPFDFSLPWYQDAIIQFQLSPATSISGWGIRLDLMYRFNSSNPIISKYLSSGFTSGQSGMSLWNGATGVFNTSFNSSDISGVNQSTDVLAYLVERTDSGYVTPLVAGYRLLNVY